MLFEDFVALVLILLFFGMLLSISFNLSFTDSAGNKRQYSFDTTSITGI
jgi:hypothetical protein